MVTTLDGHLKFLIVVEAAANTSCNSSLRTGNIQVEVCQAKVVIARLSVKPNVSCLCHLELGAVWSELSWGELLQIVLLETSKAKSFACFPSVIFHVDNKLICHSPYLVVANFYPKLFDCESFRSYVTLQPSFNGILPVRGAFCSLTGISPMASFADWVSVELDVVNAHSISSRMVKLH